MQLLLALPAYNEELDLPHVLEAFQRHLLDAGYKGQVVIDALPGFYVPGGARGGPFLGRWSRSGWKE